MHSAVGEFEEIWNQLRGERTAPLKSDFRVSQVPAKLWPFLQMMEVENNPRRYRMTVCSSANAEAHGQDVKGEYLDSLPHDGDLDRYTRGMDEAVKSVAPYYVSDSVNTADGAPMEFDVACFPLTNDDGDVTHFVLIVSSTRFGRPTATFGGGLG